MKTFNLTILNQKFTFKTDNDEKQVKKVADYVNKIMTDIVASNKVVATSNVAILTALNLADELFKTKRDLGKQVADWAEKVESLVASLEAQSK